jgi:4-hydroxybenzoate polyprenyltransferase
MAYVTVDTSMVYFCSGGTTPQCSELSLRGECLGLAILYQFFRETVCDTRDIYDDLQDGMKTLPISLGRDKTLWLMGIVGSLVDAIITRGISIDGVWSVHVNTSLLMESLLRVSMTMLFYYKVLEHHHGDVMAWGTSSLIGLTPVIWAQRSLGV